MLEWCNRNLSCALVSTASNLGCTLVSIALAFSVLPLLKMAGHGPGSSLKKFLWFTFCLGEGLWHGIILPSKNYRTHSSNALDKIIIEDNVEMACGPLYFISLAYDYVAIAGLLMGISNSLPQSSHLSMMVANDLDKYPHTYRLFISSSSTIAL